SSCSFLFVFFFQAEDGIRDFHVTGVQTCALPIYTIHGLALAWELFEVDYDNTSIDQATLVTEIRQPDGKPDVLQQIEHGVLSVVGGYRALGRLYRGIIAPTLRQYVFLGDGAEMTDY